MITSIFTFLSTRVVAVFITTFIVVAGVPSVIILIHGHHITITTQASTTRQHGDDDRARIVIHIKTVGDELIVKLNHEEATCSGQIGALSKLSKISVASTQAAINKGKSQFHAAMASYVREIESDEDEIGHMTVVTSETERVFLLRIQSISVIALGEGSKTGVLITICQTIIIEIRKVIIVVIKPPDGEDDDIALMPSAA